MIDMAQASPHHSWERKTAAKCFVCD
uniref:Uncharacterized protein n=1 Tax=Anguilla anguilla TaxID=7936 RepID=A0A0E9QEF8_ANGAN